MLEFISRIVGREVNETHVDFLSEQLTDNYSKQILYLPISCNKISNFQEFLDRLYKFSNNQQLILLKFETIQGRIRRIELESGKTLAKIRVSFDFLFLRVLPRLLFFRKLMKRITKNKLVVLSKAEGLGRMVFAGFEIIETCNLDSNLFVVIKKSSKIITYSKPSYGLIFKMDRVGKHEKLIGVYKLRTMHPYAEYLQDYILKLNGYANTGKPKNDFRITRWGKFFRRYWIDELPQLINVLKGEMKLVGVRPVSQTYYNQLNEEIKEKRQKQKPGCIPPYIALNYPTSKDSVIQAEMDYLVLKENNPYITDLKLFFLTIFNIIIKNKRSA